MATVAQLLNIDHKKNSLTLEELQAALILAQQIPAIQKEPKLMTGITTTLVAITVYLTIVKITAAIAKATPAIKLGVKAAAIPLNPAMGGEVAQDGMALGQTVAINVQKKAISTGKDAVLNYEVPGT